MGWMGGCTVHPAMRPARNAADGRAVPAYQNDTVDAGMQDAKTRQPVMCVQVRPGSAGGA